MPFPTIAANLKNDRFTKAVDNLTQALSVGGIANPVYQDAKFIINRTIEDAWKENISRVFVNGGLWEQLPSEVYSFYSDFYAPQIHTILGYMKKLNATKLSDPLIDAMRNFMKEVTPLAEMFAELKPMIMKRVPKPVEDRKAKYQAPGASQTAIGIVKTLLENLFEKASQKMALLQEDKIMSPYDIFGSRRSKYFNPDLYVIIEKTWVRYKFNGPYTKVGNATEIFTNEATQIAADIQENFVYKNLKKLDSIIEKKGNMTTGEIISSTISLGGLTGTLQFRFADGSSFVAQNSVVWSKSVYGKDFQRFPLIFQNIILPDGTKMPRPSEERMNTIFVN